MENIFHQQGSNSHPEGMRRCSRRCAHPTRSICDRCRGMWAVRFAESLSSSPAWTAWNSCTATRCSSGHSRAATPKRRPTWSSASSPSSSRRCQIDDPKGLRASGRWATTRTIAPAPGTRTNLPSAPPCLNPLFVSGERQGSDAWRSEARTWLIAGTPAFVARFQQAAKCGERS
jgi:hypothetical protein